MHDSPPDHRRAQPLLGTLVEISCRADMPWHEFNRACDAAFTKVAQVHALMSFHKPSSDLARLARTHPGQSLVIHDMTAAVLRLAQSLESSSAGAFNAAACTPKLVQRGLLPKPAGALMSEPHGSLLADLELLGPVPPDSFAVKVTRPVWVDLGGVAKGWAVDLAVQTMQAHGVDHVLVNAGGDLRVTGSHARVIHVRHPGQAEQLIPLLALANGAVATTAFQRGDTSAQTNRLPPCIVTTLEGPLTGRHWLSVSVLASTCAVADALTKVLMTMGSAAASVLRQHDAQGVGIDHQGAMEHV